MRPSPEKVARNAAIVAARAKGVPTATVAQQHGISVSRVWQILYRATHRPGGIHTPLLEQPGDVVEP